MGMTALRRNRQMAEQARTTPVTPSAPLPPLTTQTLQGLQAERDHYATLAGSAGQAALSKRKSSREAKQHQQLKALLQQEIQEYRAIANGEKLPEDALELVGILGVEHDKLSAELQATVARLNEELLAHDATRALLAKANDSLAALQKELAELSEEADKLDTEAAAKLTEATSTIEQATADLKELDERYTVVLGERNKAVAELEDLRKLVDKATAPSPGAAQDATLTGATDKAELRAAKADAPHKAEATAPKASTTKSK